MTGDRQAASERTRRGVLRIVPSYRIREWRLNFAGFALMAVFGLAQIAFTAGTLLLLYRLASWVVTGSFGFVGIGKWLRTANILDAPSPMGSRVLNWLTHFPLSLFLILMSICMAMMVVGIFVHWLNRRSAKAF